MQKLRNWDNKTWLSSKKYILNFNKFLKSKVNLNKNSKILDIGCGRANIISALQNKYEFRTKPKGIDIIKNKNLKKNIVFKKTDGIRYFKKEKQKYDLILIKQTIHLMKLNEIKKMLYLLKKNLSPNGKIFIFTLDTRKNEIPTFKKMNLGLNKSFKRDMKILKIITRLYPGRIKKRFVYNVKIQKKEYLEMIKNRYISTLIPLTKKQLAEGIEEINSKYKNILRFKDKLICVIL